MADEGNSDDDLKMTIKKVRKNITGEGEAKPTPPPAAKQKPPEINLDAKKSPTAIPGIIDPSKMRDTESQAPKKDGISSDTVVLKVVKEKKKKLAGILSASQTIRLRPPGSEGSDDAPAAAPEKDKPGFDNAVRYMLPRAIR